MHQNKNTITIIKTNKVVFEKSSLYLKRNNDRKILNNDKVNNLGSKVSSIQLLFILKKTANTPKLIYKQNTCFESHFLIIKFIGKYKQI
ncbi:MAG: hypothetical protein A3G23_04085 [Bacteroidetes bacterium RIFCSPLOWO2_12_FULL_37_12]|nr:MAG: hypothetical protein A3G23_04085 [Bacteroidetes bacterium RIFCSPLOWO2_12_FULL_37_12]